MARFTHLPDDLVEEIAIRIASSSPADHLNFTLSCRRFSQLAQTEYVYKNMTLDYMRMGPWFPFHMSTFRRCLESGNPEALFNEGMFQYFSGNSTERAVQYLAIAAQSNHTAASYLLSMLYIYLGDHSATEEGVTTLKILISQRKTFQSRQQIHEVARSLWVINEPDLDLKPKICGRHPPEGPFRGWNSVGSEDAEELPCQDCMCDREIGLFFEMFNSH